MHKGSGFAYSKLGSLSKEFDDDDDDDDGNDDDNDNEGIDEITECLCCCCCCCRSTNPTLFVSFRISKSFEGNPKY